MIHLRAIDEENFDACIKLKIKDSQSTYMAPNIYSFAQAWLYPALARPFALYSDDTLVGFVMLEYDDTRKTCGIWRFMIGEHYQGRGYGKEALLCVLTYIKENPVFEAVTLSYEPENTVAETLYRQFGFAPTGEMDGTQVIMKLSLR